MGSEMCIRDREVLVVDQAGNESTTSVEDFYINSSWWRQLLSSTWAWVIFAVTLALIALGVFWSWLRRHKDEEDVAF